MKNNFGKFFILMGGVLALLLIGGINIVAASTTISTDISTAGDLTAGTSTLSSLTAGTTTLSNLIVSGASTSTFAGAIVSNCFANSIGGNCITGGGDGSSNKSNVNDILAKYAISMWGDSLTAGNPAPAQTVAEYITQDLNYPLVYPVFNFGISGQATAQITSRFLNAPQRWHDFTTIWTGTNDGGTSEYTTQAQGNIMNGIATMVAGLASVGNTKHFIVLTPLLEPYVTNASGTPWTEYMNMRNSIATTYPNNYLDVYNLIRQTCNPTNQFNYYASSTQDQIDCAAGIIPYDMRYQGGIHIGQLADSFLAQYLAGIIEADGSDVNESTQVTPSAMNLIISDLGQTAVGYFASSTTGDSLTGGSGFSPTDNGYTTLSNLTGTYNTGDGWGSLGYLQSGNYNTAYGYNALTGITTGSGNVGIGYDAMDNGGTQADNTAVGDYALQGSYGTSSVGIGYDVAANNFNISTNDVFVGSNSALYIANNSNNTLVGAQSGYNNQNYNDAISTGSNDTFLGYNTGQASTTQLNDTTIIGDNAVAGLSDSVVIGSSSVTTGGIGLISNPDAKWTIQGNGNSTGLALDVKNSLGSTTYSVTDAGTVVANCFATSTGGNCIAASNSGGGNGTNYFTNSGATTTLSTGSVLQATIASTSLLCLNGTCSSSFGAGSQTPWTSAINGGGYALSNTSAIGVNAGGYYKYNGVNFLYGSTTLSNYFLGDSDGNLTMTGNYNFGEGTNALVDDTTGSSNIGIGYYTLSQNTTGSQNVGLGQQALGGNGTGSNNIGIGQTATYYNYSGNNNVGVGDSSLFYNETGSNNTAIGTNALYMNTSSQNTAIGAGSAQNTTGANNTSIGYNSLYSNVSGYNNTAIGQSAMFYGNATDTTAIGYQAGSDMTSGSSNNTFIGYQSGDVTGQSTSAANSTAIGYNSYTTAANQMSFGNKSVTNNIFQNQIYVATSTSAVATGVILTASDGSCHEITVNSSNVISASTVSCPN